MWSFFYAGNLKEGNLVLTNIIIKIMLSFFTLTSIYF